MELVELNEKEFKKFADASEQITFHQTIEWGKLKSYNGWKSYFVGLKDNKEIVGAALLLSKKIPS
ncbi:MAG: peptidoglycan bridge formation glycyltransferase FemA/FemB family protein, partial [Bacilli bacterium]|nr:peptidoglycan bridge formation glycyltransferase FemA/FemB family protein [Bacilli bacterium]